MLAENWQAFRYSFDNIKNSASHRTLPICSGNFQAVLGH